MPRRLNLPGAAELFRPTHDESDAGPDDEAPDAGPPQRPEVRGSGRVRHEEKITVYLSHTELLALERSRLLLRAEHGMAVDRGRIVRESLVMALADLDTRGVDSELVQRLTAP